MESKQTIKDLIFDDKNFNTGSPFGEGLIDKSFEKFGAGRSILIDKTCEITAPILPFSEIDKQGAGMYKGKKISLTERKAINESDRVAINPASNLE